MNELDRSTSSAPIEYRRSETDPMITEQVEQEPKQNDGERSKRVKQITDTTEAFSCTQYLGQHEKENEDDASYGCGRGIIADCKRTLGSHWIEEMINFNQQTIAVSFFLFFACIAPAISKFFVFFSWAVRCNDRL